MTPVIWLSGTVASVVATCVIRFGNAGAAQSLSWLSIPTNSITQSGVFVRG